MLNQIALQNVYFLDIECVSGQKEFSDLPETMQYLWGIKSGQIVKEEGANPSDTYTEKAGIYAEFGKIVCISVGLCKIDPQTKEPKLYLKSFFSHDEKELLQEFGNSLTKHFEKASSYGDPQYFLCGHNIKEFDIPYICRRMVINQMDLPPSLDISGKKPWETKHLLDTMELWSFGDRKAFTSLKLLCGVFGIPTPKDDIDGSEVGRVYWQENDLERIERYCKKDVLATVQLFLSYQKKPHLTEEQIHIM